MNEKIKLIHLLTILCLIGSINGCSTVKDSIIKKSSDKSFTKLLSLDSSLVITEALIKDVDSSAVINSNDKDYIVLKDVVAELFDPASHSLSIAF